jgi:hypothetical protein
MCSRTEELIEKKYLELAKDNSDYPSENVVTAKLMHLMLDQKYDREFFLKESVRIIYELSQYTADIMESKYITGTNADARMDWGSVSLYASVAKLLSKSLSLGDGFIYDYNDIWEMFSDIGFDRDSYWNDPMAMTIMFPKLKQMVNEIELAEKCSECDPQYMEECGECAQEYLSE